jgi:gamma-glutamylcysteine synthetase
VPASSFRHSRRLVAAAVEWLADRFARRFPSRLEGPRKIGRGAEFPLVWPDGRAADAALLWEPLLGESGARTTREVRGRRGLIVRVDFPEVAYEVEMGRATIEVVLPPAVDLADLEARSRSGFARLVRAAGARGILVLGYGIQPRTAGGVRLMTPKRRYLALADSVGPPWRHFTTTASDQLQVDITRAELVDAINLMNLLSGAIIALTANSSVYAGRVGRFVSGREGLLAGLGEHRHGMTPRHFAALEEFLTFVCEQRCYVLPKGRAFVRFGRPFAAYLASRGGALTREVWTRYLWHEHYIWNSARPRVSHGTIEVRPACQQPPGESLAAAALSLGLVEALPEVKGFVGDLLGSDPWPAMAAYRRDAVRFGLRAAEPAPGFLAGLVDLCARALRRRGRGEDRYLNPVLERLETKVLPADRAAAAFRRGGIAGLLETHRL